MKTEITQARRSRLFELFGTESPVALVTGSGAARVGRTVARHLGESGYRVVLHANKSVDEAKQVAGDWSREGIPTSFVVGPVDDEKVVEGWVEECREKHRGLQVVVNTAAIWEPSPLDTLTKSELVDQLSVNLLGPTLVCKFAGLAMTKQPGGGAIINIGDAAIGRPYRDFTAYLLSKSAIPTLTQLMAIELAERNPRVRVSAIMPGPVLLDSRVDREKTERIIDETLLHRLGTPDNIAAGVLALVENPFITGACLPIDGGRSFYTGGCDETLAHPSYKAPS